MFCWNLSRLSVQKWKKKTPTDLAWSTWKGGHSLHVAIVHMGVLYDTKNSNISEADFQICQTFDICTGLNWIQKTFKTRLLPLNSSTRPLDVYQAQDGVLLVILRKNPKQYTFSIFYELAVINEKASHNFTAEDSVAQDREVQVASSSAWLSFELSVVFHRAHIKFCLFLLFYR